MPLSLRKVSIRVQLLLLVGAVALPLGGLIGWLIVGQSRTLLERDYADVRLLADNAAARLDGILRDYEAAHTRIAERPLVRALDPGRCDPIIAQYPTLRPEFISLDVFDLSGNLICAFSPNRVSAEQVSGHEWFQEARRSGKFSISGAFLGPTTQRWVSVLSAPVRDEQGKVVGLMAMAIDLLMLGQKALGPVPAPAILLAVDRQGRFLMRSADPQAWLGKPGPKMFVEQARGRQQGFLGLRGVDGVQRIYAFTQVASTTWWIAAGLPKDAALAGSRRLLVQSLGAGLVVLVLAAALAWQIARRWIVAPVQALADTARKVAAGDLGARASIDAPPEISSVARQLNQMLEVRERSDGELRERERFVSTLLEHLPGMAYRARNDPDWTMAFVSDGCKAVTGHDASELRENRVKAYADLIHPDDRDALWNKCQVSLAARTPCFNEYRLVTPDGVRWVWEHAGGVYSADGALLAIEGFVQDVTERKRVEQALQLSEERLQRALAASDRNLWDFDLTSRDVYLSEGWSRLRGGPDEVTHTTFEALELLVPENERLALDAALARALKDPQTPYRVEHRVRRLDGSWFWNLQEGKVAEHNAEGRALRMVGTNRDITQRKQAEAALAQSQDRFRLIVETALDAVIQMGQDGTIIGWNAQAAAMFGWTAAQAIGRPLHETIIPPRHREAHQRGLARFLAGGEGPVLNQRVELTALHCDGHEFPVELNIVPLRVDDRHEFNAFVRDLSERQRAEAEQRALEARLRESQKMEAIGTLAGGVAHDFNNILAALLGYAALAREEVGKGHAAQASLEQINRAGLRGRALVRQILAFSRRQPQQFESRRLRPLVEESLALLRATLPTVIALDRVFSDEPISVRADATQLQQVLLNLCTNAWHALEGGSGRIEVGLEPVTLDAAARGAGELALPSGRYAHLWVSDDGCGIDPVTRARLFEPFFTTKPVGKGTGLGLSVVHGIVSAHDGAITVDSEPGRGSCFHLYFPRLAEDAEDAPTEPGELPEVPMASNAAGRHVFYLDDDEVMLLLVERLLQRSGYRVSTFVSAEAALAAVRESPFDVDLVVSDFNMPGLSGLDVARELARIRADLPVVISSGLVTEELLAAAQQAGVRALLNKENTLDELTQVVAQTLDSAAPSGRGEA